MNTTDSNRQPTLRISLAATAKAKPCAIFLAAACSFLRAVTSLLKTIRSEGLVAILASASAVALAVNGLAVNGLAMNGLAQDAPLPPSDESDSIEDFSSQLRTDRRTIQHVELLALEVQRGNLKAVREQLELLQQAEPTLLVPRLIAPATTSSHANGDSNWVPLYRAVFDVVHQLSEADRAELGRTEQDRANFEFKRILNGQQWSPLMKLLLRFPTTDAAYRTHLLWAQQHLDRGNQLAARLWLAPLTKPGIPAPWRTTAERVAERIQQKTVAAAQRHSQTATLQTHQQNESAVTGLQQSDSGAAHGSSSRFSANSATGSANSATGSANSATGHHQVLPVDVNISNTPSVTTVGQTESAGQPVNSVNQSGSVSIPDQFPLQIGWIHQPNMPPVLRAVCNKLAEFAAQINVMAWSNWHPVIDEKAVFIRTLRGVTALDRKTGTTMWSWVARTPLDEAVTTFTSSSSINRLLDARDAVSGYASLDR